MGTRISRNALLLSIILWSGCSQSTVTPEDYTRFIEESSNGYRKELAAGQWVYKVQYKPAGYIYLQEKHGQSASLQEYNGRARQLEGWCFFNVYTSHSKDRHGSPLRLISNNLDDYNKYLGYYLTENKKNFRLIANADTLIPKIYEFENNYNLSPEDVMVLGFELPDKSKQPQTLNLVYTDEILNTGIVRFSFNKEDLKAEPAIKFN